MVNVQLIASEQMQGWSCTSCPGLNSWERNCKHSGSYQESLFNITFHQCKLMSRHMNCNRLFSRHAFHAYISSCASLTSVWNVHLFLNAILVKILLVCAISLAACCLIICLAMSAYSWGTLCMMKNSLFEGAEAPHHLSWGKHQTAARTMLLWLVSAVHHIGALLRHSMSKCYCNSQQGLEGFGNFPSLAWEITA